mmetsp:Transcript_13758/g.17953  ORF Transcript_13758/g.17953 Transcript_13758/m.17953 type:complete len:360 (+) Transcript_13758:146-1225(+)|eukprot:CAMPEP_0198145426 /NCGR_PEP_ID=MMETSP1443-20131203/23386_1 /TAXON_ID=186043 /ORGANISM="Entomoneis sp., Strain CCMP2396" /LENGTH=359 /DNA_ID=CAMNT_0043809071 /DNA_START=89 /DNA_END=1168 /DNA_ORIENTATION=-
MVASAVAAEAALSQKDALIQLMAPDGYYSYLGVERRLAEPGEATTDTNSQQQGAQQSQQQPVLTIDEDAVKKAYRKLSRRHHPDKGGDPDTFRLLNRAQRVLLHPKLRAQYDNLGIDLDEDDADMQADGDVDDAGRSTNKEGISQGIVSELASLALTGIIQLAIRTMLMGAVAVIVVRYRLTLYPALLFLAYTAFSVLSKASLRGGSVYDTGVRAHDAFSPMLIMLGLLLMSFGRSPAKEEQEAIEWTWIFWLGESLVVALFTYNSVSSIPWNAITFGVLGLAGSLLALWFRGSFFNYLAIVVLEVILAVLVALAFPIMELLLEAILNEKLKKVGEKVRDHHRQMEEYYKTKQELGKRS